MERKLILLHGVLSQMGDQMWSFAAYLLLAKAFPTQKILLGGIYGLSLSISGVLFSSALGNWIDRTPRLRAIVVMLIVQNISVALCALLQVLGLLDIIPESIPSLLPIAIAIALACNARLASIGCRIILERDWLPQIFGICLMVMIY